MFADPIPGATEKVIRAYKLRGEASAILDGYVESAPFEVSLDDEKREVVRFSTPVPPQLSVRLGEIVYQLRSALDHAYYELVRVNHAGAQLSPGWERAVEFPLLLNPPKALPAAPPASREHFRAPGLSAVSDRAFEFIESVQPYRRRDDGVSGMLRTLRILSNIDKHRRLNVAVPRLKREEHWTDQNGHPVTTLFLPIGDGGELLRWTTESPDTRSRRLSTEVFFDEPELGPAIASPVSDVLFDIPSLVLGWLLPRLRTLIVAP